MDDLMLDVGQANELKLAFRKADFDNADIKKLCEGNLLKDIYYVLHGHSKISFIKETLDCSKKLDIKKIHPLWSIAEQDDNADVIKHLDTSKINFIEHHEYFPGSHCNGEELLLYLKGLKRPLAGLRQFLALVTDINLSREKKNSVIERLRIGHSIKDICFFGTIILDDEGNRRVPEIYWRAVGSGWQYHYKNLKDDNFNKFIDSSMVIEE